MAADRDSGRELEPIVLALGGWGLHFPPPPAPATLSATSVLIYLRGAARPDPRAPEATYRLEIDDRTWTVRTAAGRVDIRPGEPATADAGLSTDPATLNALLENPAGLDAAISDGTVTADGDLPALRRLLHAIPAAQPDRGSAGPRVVPDIERSRPRVPLNLC